MTFRRLWTGYAVLIVFGALLGAWAVYPWFAAFVVAQGVVQVIPAVWLCCTS